MKELFFWIFSVLAVGGALLTITRKNPLNCALALVVTFIALAGLYFLADAPFVGVVQILVYAGAIMVLVIFVIMFLNLPETQLEEERLSRAGLLLALFLLAPVFTLCAGVFLGEKTPPPATLPAGFGSVEGVGALIFERYLFQFEAVSVLLLVAIVGAVVLAKKRL